MANGQKRPHRRSIRLQEYDYSQPGAYFVTLCTHGKRHLFGKIVDGQMRANSAGSMIEQWWQKIPRKFPSIQTDIHVIMPNHLHGVVIVVGADHCIRPEHREGARAGAPLPTIMQWFKTMTTNVYINGVQRYGWPAFSGRLWQRNYYEHVIRNENDLHWLRQYIRDNPIKWLEDPNN